MRSVAGIGSDDIGPSTDTTPVTADAKDTACGAPDRPNRAESAGRTHVSPRCNSQRQLAHFTSLRLFCRTRSITHHAQSKHAVMPSYKAASIGATLKVSSLPAQVDRKSNHLTLSQAQKLHEEPIPGLEGVIFLGQDENIPFHIIEVGVPSQDQTDFLEQKLLAAGPHNSTLHNDHDMDIDDRSHDVHANSQPAFRAPSPKRRGIATAEAKGKAKARTRSSMRILSLLKIATTNARIASLSSSSRALQGLTLEENKAASSPLMQHIDPDLCLSTSSPNSASLRAKGLSLHINIGSAAFNRSLSNQWKNDQDIKIEVYVNGGFHAGHVMPSLKKHSPKFCHCMFSGYRLKKFEESAWVVQAPDSHDYLSKEEDLEAKALAGQRANDRWDAINRALAGEACVQGSDTEGRRPPSAEFMLNLAELPMPEVLVEMYPTATKMDFGVVDVVFTLGSGKKPANATFFEGPERSLDPDFKVETASSQHASVQYLSSGPDEHVEAEDSPSANRMTSFHAVSFSKQRPTDVNTVTDDLSDMELALAREGALPAGPLHQRVLDKRGNGQAAISRPLWLVEPRPLPAKTSAALKRASASSRRARACGGNNGTDDAASSQNVDRTTDLAARQRNLRDQNLMNTNAGVANAKNLEAFTPSNQTPVVSRLIKRMRKPTIKASEAGSGSHVSADDAASSLSLLSSQPPAAVADRRYAVSHNANAKTPSGAPQVAAPSESIAASVKRRHRKENDVVMSGLDDSSLLTDSSSMQQTGSPSAASTVPTITVEDTSLTEDGTCAAAAGDTYHLNYNSVLTHGAAAVSDDQIMLGPPGAEAEARKLGPRRHANGRREGPFKEEQVLYAVRFIVPVGAGYDYAEDEDAA